MKINYLLAILLIIFFSGCVSTDLNVTYDKRNNEVFENYVDNLEVKLKNCYESIPKSSLQFQKYVLREDYYTPRYAKLKLFYKGLKYPYTEYLNVIYIFKEKNSNRVIVRDIGLDAHTFVKLESFMNNNMECNVNE